MEAQVLEEIVREKELFRKKFTICGGTKHSVEKCFKKIIHEKEKALAAGALDNRQK